LQILSPSGKERLGRRPIVGSTQGVSRTDVDAMKKNCKRSQRVDGLLPALVPKKSRAQKRIGSVRWSLPILFI
jgi:hypothetical protein